jgi:hypothetical protein
MPSSRVGVRAHGEDGGGDHVSGRGDDFHVVRLRHVGGHLQRLVPA